MIDNLQILRAFAALNVVLFHIIETSTSYALPTIGLELFRGWGSNGVDIFFVISGFVMLYTQFNNKRGFVSFIKSRLIRIVPLYWFMTTLIIIILLVLPSAFREMVVKPDWIIASYFFISQVLFDEYPIVYLGWTLEWEMLFYLVFGLSLYFRNWALSIGFTLFILSFIAMLSSNLIILEFFGGLLAAILYKRNVVSNEGGLFLLLSGFILLMLSISPLVKDLHLDRVIISGIPSLLIVIGAVTVKQLRNRLLTFLGDASYSIYLVQILSIPVFYKAASYSGLTVNGDILAILCLFFTAFAGSLLHVIIEKPSTKMLRKVT